MQDELKKLRQLKAAIRLRTLQREKAELQLSHALQSLREAEQRLHGESTRYHRILAQHQQLVGRGVSLDPALQQQRLLALASVRAEVSTRQREVSQARVHGQEARALLMKARVDVDVVDKAKQRVGDSITYQRLAGELIDIFDAQQGPGEPHGR